MLYRNEELYSVQFIYKNKQQRAWTAPYERARLSVVSIPLAKTVGSFLGEASAVAF